MKTKMLLTILFFGAAVILSAQNSWTQKASIPGLGRRGPVGFAIGNKGYVGTGLYDPTVTLRNDFWEYDPATNTWTQKANFPGTARFCATSFVIGNFGYVGNGCDAYPVYHWPTDFWKYDPSTNTWSQVANFIAAGRYNAPAFVVGTKAYCGTGWNQTHYFNDFYEYNSVTDSWTALSNFPGVVRESSFACSIGNIGYLGGGYTGGIVNDFYKYDPTTGVWTPLANYPYNMYNGASFVLNNMFYVGTGGTSLSPFLCTNRFWVYNPATNVWSAIPNMPDTSRLNDVGFAIGGVGYCGSGEDSTIVNNLSSFWAYTPGPSCNNLATTTQATNAMCSTCANGWAVAIPSGGTAPFTYVWTTTPVQTTQSANGLLPGNYTVNVTDSNNCSASSIVTIGNANVCGANYLLYPDTNIAHTYYIVNQSWGTNPIHYDWNWGDNTTHDTTLYPSHTYATAGYYNICLTVTDAVGCSSTYCYNYYLMRGQNSMINVIVMSPTTGTNQIKKNDYCALFPNPNNGNFTFNYHQSMSNCELQLIDLSGRVVYKQTFIELEGSQTINVSNLDNGIYYWKMVSDNVILSKGKMTIVK